VGNAGDMILDITEMVAVPESEWRPLYGSILKPSGKAHQKDGMERECFYGLLCSSLLFDERQTILMLMEVNDATGYRFRCDTQVLCCFFSTRSEDVRRRFE
jgi:hypothetical protein